MSRELRVVTDDLAVSGLRTNAHAENVEAVHAASDSRIESAIPGWTGASQSAMAAVATRWQGIGATLSARLFSHAHALHTTQNAYETTEFDNAEAVRHVGAQAV